MEHEIVISLRFKFGSTTLLLSSSMSTELCSFFVWLHKFSTADFIRIHNQISIALSDVKNSNLHLF